MPLIRARKCGHMDMEFRSCSFLVCETVAELQESLRRLFLLFSSSLAVF